MDEIFSLFSISLFHLGWLILGVPESLGVSQVAQLVKNLPAVQEIQVRSLVRKSPGGGNSNPLQYSCLGNPMDREAWQAVVHRIAKELDMSEAT